MQAVLAIQNNKPFISYLRDFYLFDNRVLEALTTSSVNDSGIGRYLADEYIERLNSSDNGVLSLTGLSTL